MKLTCSPFVYEIETLNRSISGIQKEVEYFRREMSRMNRTQGKRAIKTHIEVGSILARKVIKLERIIAELRFIKMERMFAGYSKAA
jgi:hypothetical protein